MSPEFARTDDEALLAEPSPGVPARAETDATRIARMSAELAMGFATLASVERAVSMFGSARVPPGTAEYERARDLAHRLGEAGFAVITGGGPGLMEAANRGARDAGAMSIGLTIELPHEELGNAWVEVPLHFHYFFTRKVMFVRYAAAFVVLPGGFGTLDELFEVLTLIQTGKIRYFPVVLVDSAYWAPLIEFLRTRLAAEGRIDPDDLDLLRVEDDPDRIVDIVEQAALRTRPRA